MDAPASAWIETVSRLADDESQGAFFRGRRDLLVPSTVERLHEEVLRVLYADTDLADRLARAASRVSSELGDPAAQATGLRALGHVSYARSRFQDAVAHYQAALEIFSRLQLEAHAGRTLISGMQPLVYLGRYRDAEEWAARARAIFARLGDGVRLARLASNVGNMLYRQDRYAEALEAYEEARATLSQSGEPRDVAAVLSNVAVCNISLNRFPEALAVYRQARDYCQEHGLALLVASADYNIAYLNYLQGDYWNAIELYKRSRRHCKQVGDAYHAALCDLDEAELYMELNLNVDACHLAEDAARGFDALSMPYERAKATVTQAVAAARCGQPVLATRLFRSARELFVRQKNALWPALIDLYRAMLLERENRDRESQRLCLTAYPALAAANAFGPTNLADFLQCKLHLKENNLAGAGEAIARASARLETADSPALRFHCAFLQAQLEEQRGDFPAMARSYEAARRQIETLRSRLWGDEPKISFLKDKLAVYENLVSLALGEDAREEAGRLAAFAYIQQAKSRTMADLISQFPSAPLSGANSDRGASEIEELRRKLNSLYRRRERLELDPGEEGAGQIGAIKLAVRECESRLTRMMTAEAAAHTGGIASELALPQILDAIPPGAALLEYYVVKGRLWVAVLDSSGLEFQPLGDVDRTRMQLRLLRFQMRKLRLSPDLWREAGEGAKDAASAHLRDLYTGLVAPLAERLSRASHLIVAPHDLLHHLPFHALWSPEGYLIDRFTVSYAPSASVYARCAVRQASAATQSLVLAVPDERAPHIAREAEIAASTLPDARLYLGDCATQETLQKLGPNSRFIHIAAHGLFRRDNPLFSSIRLGDSHLTLLDLYRMPLSAEMVTLSGCSTGLNVVTGGDELLGLMRGVLLAGARGVVVTLWDVNDWSTARFMAKLYGELQATSNKAVALRAAMLEVRGEQPHPYYWAPFVFAGKYL